jgi:hypothetical protein
MADMFSDMTEQPMPGPPPVETHDGATIDRTGPDIVVTMEGVEAKPDRQSQHEENLADQLTESERRKIADQIIDWVELDEQARLHWKERMENALELLGLKSADDNKSPFKGSSTVTHPLIAEACVQFQARAIQEVFPAEGPVKTIIVGEPTPDVMAQAKRVEDYMNFHLTEEDPGYFWDTDKMLFELPTSGSLFRKIFKDPLTNQCIGRYVKAEDFIVPYSAKTLQDAPRYTHRFTVPINDIKRSMAGGFYRECELGGPVQVLDADRTRVQDIADDRQASYHGDDDIRTLYECHCDIEMPWDEGSPYAYPYIVTVDKDSSQVLSIRRNWDHDDESKKKIIWFIHYIYLPGLGFYGFGLLHLIGSLGTAATGALRALLDAAARANFPGGFKAKEARRSGEISPAPGEWVDVDMTAEELSKAFYPMPYKEPSQGLLELLTQMVESGQRFASTTEQMVGEAANTGPVGTTMALIEQGSKVFSSIHKRLHNALRDEFRLLVELISDQMDEVYPYALGGVPQEIMRADFDDRVDVIPVSDPTLSSTTQRIALAQEVMKLIQENPDVYDASAKREANRRMLEALRVQDAEALLPKQKAHRLDPVSENQLIMVGKPVNAFPEQDHMAHLQAHQTFMQGVPEKMQAALQGIMMAHMAEHYAYQYRNQIQQQTGPLPPLDLNQDIKDVSADVDAAISRAVAQVHPQMAQLPGMGPPPLPPEVQQQMQQMQQALQQAQQQLQKAGQEVQAQQQEIQAYKTGAASEVQKLQATQGQLKQLQLQNEERQAQAAAELAAQKRQLDEQMAAIQQNAAKIEQGLEMQVLQANSAAEKAKANLEKAVAKLQTLHSNLDTRLAESQAEAKAVDAKTRKKSQDDATATVSQALAPISELIKVLSAEKTIVRGPDGRAVGIQTVVKQ